VKKLLSRITIIGLAFLVSGIVRTFLLQTYYIPTVSMKPTLNVEDRVLVLKYDAFINNLVYGDIIVFQLDGVGGQSILQDYLDSININIIMNPELANEVYIKRIIGVSNDKIKLTVNGEIFVNDVVLNNYSLPQNFEKETIWQVPEGKFFVLGDNITHSMDSRSIGLIDKKNIVGKAWIKFYPFDEIVLLND
jgi:signal peptidase I|tara:strand:+ start:2161 stop:2736 length:576 start_codon:yes stop_codon:yes gene_type:complete